MNRIDPSRVLDEISEEQVPLDLNLLPGILSVIRKGNIMTAKTQNKFIPAILVTMIVAAILVVAIPGGVSAMRKMLGFIPGVGLVEQNTTLRILAEPVSETRDGFTVTVENAVLDSEHTVVTYNVEGLFEGETSQAIGTSPDVCFDAAELRLPDGTVYQVPGGFPDTTWESGYRVQYSYPAVPADIDQASLFLPCLNAKPAGQGPENWEIPLAFVPAPEDMVVYALGEQNTPAAEDKSADSGNDNTQAIGINLENVIPLPDGQLVQIRVDWSKDTGINWVNLDKADVQILDANGQEVAFEPSFEAIDPNADSFMSTVYGFKTSILDATMPARLVVNTASQVVYSASANFTFDPGIGYQSGQVWELNQDLEINGHVLRILNVSLAEIEGNVSLTVNMQSNDGILSASVVDTAHPPVSGGGSDAGVTGESEQPFWSTINYDGGLPEGPLTLTISSYTTRMAGPWEVEWTPAVPAEVSVFEAEPQDACLDEAVWKAAQSNAQPLPDELNLKILTGESNDATMTNQLSITRLDGSEKQTLVEDGYTASVSPDGSRVVYSNPNGDLYIYNLSTGTNEPIAGASSNTGVVQPFWSPDGQRIAYTGSPDGASPNIFLSNLDGSNARFLEKNEPIKIMQGWTADQKILYVTQDQNGPLLKLLDPDTEETSTLFNVPMFTTPVTVSKDGMRLALNWLDQESGKQSLYVFSLDGSQRKTLLEMNSDGNIRSMLWSPDGKWLLVDLAWTAGEANSKALIQADTCQIIPLANLQGTVMDWVP